MAVASTMTTTHIPSGSRRASALQSFGIRKKAEIDIVLDGKDEFIHSYSTFDEIRGNVNLRFDKDTPVESLNISFQGQSQTWVENLTSIAPNTGRATARHMFLRLQQPIEGNPFPEDNVAKEGVTYTIPFNFVVPEKVLPFICSHSVEGEHVKVQHCYLPPSIGEEMLAGEGSTLMDDLCPSMAKIVYSIRVNVVKSALKGRNKEEIHNSVGIRIIPSRPEIVTQTASPFREGCLKYNLRKEKNVRKGILKFGRKQGRLTAETSQPRSLRLPHQQEPNKNAATTTATINFRYDPASLEEEPPQLTGVDSRIKAFTFFGAAPFKHLPNPTNYDIWSNMHGQYALNVDLSTMNLSSVRWIKHDPEGPFAERERQQSIATSTSSKKDIRRKLSTSTGTASTGGSTRISALNRTTSNLSHLSDESYSPASSTTTLSTNLSPTLTGSNTSFPGSTTVPPSTKYDQTLPYYTTSIIVPITLPSIRSNSSTTAGGETPSQRSSSAVIEQSIAGPNSGRGSTTTTKVASASLPTTHFSRKRGIPTFLPTFHSCLVAREYALELTVHATNPAPQISLRTPIQIVSDPSPPPPLLPSGMRPSTNQIPMSWYDPFDLSTNTHGIQDEDTANDEAIARALGPHYISNLVLGNTTAVDAGDQVPSYEDAAEQQIRSTTFGGGNSSSNAANPSERRHNSVPLTSTSLLSSQSSSSPRADAHVLAADKPPEYNSALGFRRRQSTPLQQRCQNTSTDTPATTAQRTADLPRSEPSAGRPRQQDPSQRRKESLGWTKKLGLRN